jgi:hypothetical protein
MKLFSSLSLVRGVGPILAILLFANCTKEEIATQQVSSEAAITGLSQTRTGNVLNDQIPYDLWIQPNPQLFAADDGVYATSIKLSRGRGAIPIVLQDFRFDIPSNAIIESIVIRARRFKTGKGSISDHSKYLVTQINGSRGYYGVIFVDPNLIPGTETEIMYAQNGAGDNGGLPVDELTDDYQWTPAMINNPIFGVWINHGNPSGSLVAYYDLIDITVHYSLP